MVASFFLLLSADRLGRRRLMTWTIVGFALTNGAAGFATDKIEFAIWQFLARIFLTAEYALAVIVIGEEFPARRRGLAIAILTSFATIGVMVIARVQPFILLPDCVSGTLAAGDCVAPTSNTLRDAGLAIVSFVQTQLGRPVDRADWRILYVLGLAPLLLVILLRFALRETRRFTAEQARRRGAAAALGRAAARRVAQGPRPLAAPLSPPHLARDAAVELRPAASRRPPSPSG